MKRFASIRSCFALAVLCCLLLGFSCALAQEEVGFALCDYDPLTSDTSLYARTPTFDYDTEAFYKVVLDLTPPVKMIALIVPNQDVGRRQAADFFCTVDEVEKRSGLDFFSSLDADEEKRLESSADFGTW
jgi:hypothetical protein